jgi:hypothetical protein
MRILAFKGNELHWDHATPAAKQLSERTPHTLNNDPRRVINRGVTHLAVIGKRKSDSAREFLSAEISNSSAFMISLLSL